MNKRVRKKYLQKKCNFCRNMKSIFYLEKATGLSVKEVYIERDGSLSVTVCDGEPTKEFLQELSAPLPWSQINIEINYCPMCGKRLKECGENEAD